jgi:hypothetical protein
MKTQHTIQDTIWKSAALNDCIRKQKKCLKDLILYHKKFKRKEQMKQGKSHEDVCVQRHKTHETKEKYMKCYPLL